MTQNTNRNALPGRANEIAMAYRRVVLSNIQYLSGGAVLEGALVYADNGTDDDVVLSGTLMFRQVNDKYAPLISASSLPALATADTDFTVSLAEAQQIQLLLAAGYTTQYLFGADAGVGIAAHAITIDNVNVTTGLVTLTAPVGDDFSTEASLLAVDPTRLSGIAVVEKQDGLLVSDQEHNKIDISWPDVVIGGWIDSSQVPGWPTGENAASGLAAAIEISNDLHFDFNYRD